MDAKGRIEKVLEINSLNAKTLSERIGLDRPQAIYDIINGKTKTITEKMAFKIISAFPNIQKVWLLTGEGNVLHRVDLAPDIDINKIEDNDIENDRDNKSLLEIIADQQKTIKYLRERIESLEGKKQPNSHRNIWLTDFLKQENR